MASMQLMASGLWMQPTMGKNLPKSRFSVKCKFVVEGKSKDGFVRWKPGEGWHPGNGWYTGEVKDCKIQAQPTRKKKDKK